MPRHARLPLLVVVALVTGGLGGCATTGEDPWEGPNRAIFGFNEGVDRYFLEPVATGYDFVVPDRAQWGVTNFFDNLRMPVVFLNDLLQGKPVAAVQDVGRFVVNTTVGVVGLIDVASRIDIPFHDEDFGQTLGVWGLSSGPYMVLPFLGPSSVRDTAGLAVDSVSRPEVWLVDSWAIRLGARALDIVNTRARLLEEIRETRETALDYYVFVRNAYLRNRELKVRDGKIAPAEGDEDLYELDEDLYELDDDLQDEDDLYEEPYELHPEPGQVEPDAEPGPPGSEEPEPPPSGGPEPAPAP